MKKNLLFIGILFLGFSMMISSIILSNSMKTPSQLNGILNGSLTMEDSQQYDTGMLQQYGTDILQQYDAQILLGYDANTEDEQRHFIKDIENGPLEGLPYTKINGRYLFSKKAMEEWLYNRTIKQVTQ